MFLISIKKNLGLITLLVLNVCPMCQNGSQCFKRIILVLAVKLVVEKDDVANETINNDKMMTWMPYWIFFYKKNSGSVNQNRGFISYSNP